MYGCPHFHPRQSNLIFTITMPSTVPTHASKFKSRRALKLNSFNVDMTPPFVTPAMLVDAVRYLCEEMRASFEKITPWYKQGGHEPTRLYTRNELAQSLNVSLTTLDTMRQDPAFPCLHLSDAKIRGSVRFDPEAVKAYLERKNALAAEMAK